MKNKGRIVSTLGRISVLLALVVFLFFASLDVFRMGWGSGTWLARFSIKWGPAFFLFIAVNLLIIVLVGFILWRREKFQPHFEKIVTFRQRLGIGRWLPALLVIIAPVWFFQYTHWGVVFTGTAVRILIWVLTVFGLAFFIQRGEALLSWPTILVASLLITSEFVIVDSFVLVSDYPFSLGWSEGNRMWDYSMLFGRQLYDYPTDREIFVHLDTGRQFVGGLPFLIPDLTIEVERFWIALTNVMPYLLLGFAIFRFARKDPKIWLLGSLWVLVFLRQGPIHPPLILCAVVVALLWKSPLWLALTLIAITGYAAEESRYTWLFAPGMWIGMLELAGATLQNNKIPLKSWVRAISLGLAGMAGGQFGRQFVGLLAGDADVSTAISISSAVSDVSNSPQPLLWYRLLPNSTYSIGVLFGLLIAVLPLIVTLIYLVVSIKWRLNIWQGLAIVTPLLAFLGVGLIISTKIGGGGDLHNLDMFLIGLMFTAVIAWQKGGSQWVARIGEAPIWIRLVMVALVVIPISQSLLFMRPLVLPADETEVNQYLETIQNKVDIAKSQGEILFMDQRQLLTFGYIKNVPFTPDYEKKVLMDLAMGGNPNYLATYYRDLANKRFSIIITEVLKINYLGGSSFTFIEENDSWVYLVSEPTLCFYKPILTNEKMNIQLLIPRQDISACDRYLSFGLP